MAALRSLFVNAFNFYRVFEMRSISIVYLVEDGKRETPKKFLKDWQMEEF